MTAFLNTQTPLDQLDRELRELAREHGHVLDLDAFRRHVDTASQRSPAGPADSPTRHAAKTSSGTS